VLACQVVRILHHPSKTDLNLANVLFALSDPTRLHIVKTLAENGEMMCVAIDVPLSKSSCSRHYKVLRESGIIQMRPQGTAYLNSLRRKDLNERFPGLLAAVVRSAGNVS
jgi:DNA-binding transcriptional ArsR family regulator